MKPEDNQPTDTSPTRQPSGICGAMLCSLTEDSVVDLIRARGKVGRTKYKTSMDRKDLHPDEWIRHFQEELADGLQYAERMKGATELLHEARDIMMTLLHEREWECAQDWVDKYHAQFLPANAKADSSAVAD